jgi:hypothetical protein
MLPAHLSQSCHKDVLKISTDQICAMRRRRPAQTPRQLVLHGDREGVTVWYE